MTVKDRKKTIYFALLINIIFIVTASLMLENSKTAVLFMLVVTPIATILGTILPLLDKFWDAIANFFYLLAIVFPTVILVSSGLSFFILISSSNQISAIDCFKIFSLAVYGCYGVAVVLLGKTHRAYPFWYKRKNGDSSRKSEKNNLGFQKIQGFRGFNQTDQLK